MQEIDFSKKVLPNTKQLEAFQNLTLRPTIKSQHETIMALFNDLCKNAQLSFSNKDLITKKTMLDNLFAKNTAFTNQLIGLAIGHFSKEELSDYLKDSKEYNKRIKQIIKERIFSKI
jgi:hypothetical protein